MMNPTFNVDTFPGGKYNKPKSIFDRIEELYNYLIKKENTYILYHNFKPIVADKKNIIPMNVHLILKPC